MKRGESIEIQQTLEGKYWVMFYDNGGESCLAKCGTLPYAKKRATHFRAELKAGRLLKEDKSVWL